MSEETQTQQTQQTQPEQPVVNVDYEIQYADRQLAYWRGYLEAMAKVKAALSTPPAPPQSEETA